MSALKKWNSRENSVEFIDKGRKVPNIKITQEHALFGTKTINEFEFRQFGWKLVDDNSYQLEAWETQKLISLLQQQQASYRSTMNIMNGRIII